MKLLLTLGCTNEEVAHLSNQLDLIMWVGSVIIVAAVALFIYNIKG